MKPRTKLQFEVLRNSNYLTPITKQQTEFGLNDCLEHLAFTTKHKAFCVDCGERFDKSIIKQKNVTCPNCKTKLEVFPTLKTTFNQKVIFAVGEIFGEFQVIRYFLVESTHKLFFKRKASVTEICQHWILDGLKFEVVAKHHNYNWCQDSWTGSLEIRNKNLHKYSKIYHYETFPDSHFKGIYSMYGIDHKMKGLNYLDAMSLIPRCPTAETLVKTQQYNLLYHYKNESYKISEHWNSIKICIRNNYIVEKPTEYLDYLSLLKFFKKDLRSPKYLFPKDVKKEHDKLVAKKREIQRKEEIESRKKMIKRDQLNYDEMKSIYFDLCFIDKNLKIEVLKTIEQFIENGDVLKHCVYTNEYYKLQNSLILQASIKGKLTETIEVNLVNFEVTQARGFENKATKYHERIVSLIDQNMHQIESRTQLQINQQKTA